ncbi:hypothetical protein [Polynucleobacter necessarius]|uniref:hypothetical protein n=1 Tax=Polynucleobacter necessarius TaxID=576610 RepID=UPI001558FA35|nr:hypothetical protein [Polynucleobacter necessarius]
MQSGGRAEDSIAAAAGEFDLITESAFGVEPAVAPTTLGGEVAEETFCGSRPTER